MHLYLYLYNITKYVYVHVRYIYIYIYIYILCFKSFVKAVAKLIDSTVEEGFKTIRNFLWKYDTVFFDYIYIYIYIYLYIYSLRKTNFEIWYIPNTNQPKMRYSLSIKDRKIVSKADLSYLLSMKTYPTNM